MMLVFANTDLSESVTQRYLYHQSDNESGGSFSKVEINYKVIYDKY